MNISLRDAGGSVARGVTANLAAAGTCATIRTTTFRPLQNADIGAGATATNQSAAVEQPEIDLSPTACTTGAAVSFTVTALAALGNSWNLPFAVIIP